MPDDSLGFAVKAAVAHQIVQRFTPTCPSRREADIQVDKLRRMADDFTKQFPWHMVRSVPAKKLRKMKGPHMHRLVQQAKRVDGLLTRLLTEDVLIGRQEQKLKRKQVQAVCRKLVEKLNKNVHQKTMQLQLGSLKAILSDKPMKGFGNVTSLASLKEL